MAHILSSVTGEISDKILIQRALISVSDKTNLIPLALYLYENHVEILSTGKKMVEVVEEERLLQDENDDLVLLILFLLCFFSC